MRVLTPKKSGNYRGENIKKNKMEFLKQSLGSRNQADFKRVRGNKDKEISPSVPMAGRSPSSKADVVTKPVPKVTVTLNTKIPEDNKFVGLIKGIKRNKEIKYNKN